MLAARTAELQMHPMLFSKWSAAIETIPAELVLLSYSSELVKLTSLLSNTCSGVSLL